MANSSEWGDGAANNTVGWGQGANNAIGWGSSHATSWAGATDIVGLTTDADAQAFITAAAITDATQKSAIDALVKGMKADGIWTKMKAIYPFVGGTATTHKWNLKDPRDLDAAFRLVFNGGWTHSSTGATPNGTNGYADTKLNWESNTNLNDVSFGCYWRNDIQIAGNYYGVVSGGAYALIRDRVICDFYVNDDGAGTIATLSKGLHLATRKNSTQQTLYVNGSGTAQSRASLSKPNLNFYFGGSNGFTSFTNNQMALGVISDGLTNTEAANLYTRVQNFQVALSRNV